MATESGRTDTALTAALRQAPQRFHFVRAVRLLERWLSASRPPRELAPASVIGVNDDPRRALLRLRAAMHLDFPATDVLELAYAGHTPELNVRMLGLNGAGGVMPNHYSRYILESSREKNPAPRDFLDLFNHRALSYFLRASEKYRLSLSYEVSGLLELTRRKCGDGHPAATESPASGAVTPWQLRGSQHLRADPIVRALLGVIGQRAESLSNRQAVDDEALLFFSGFLARRVRTASGLRRMLESYFQRPVVIEQFKGRWARLPAEEQSRLGAAGGYCTLGVDAVLGERTYDVQGSFRLKLGPLSYGEFKSFLPKAEATSKLVALTRRAVGAELNFDLQLVLRREEVPPLKLASQGIAQLGWNTWLPSSAVLSDADEAEFSLNDHDALRMDAA